MRLLSLVVAGALALCAVPPPGARAASPTPVPGGANQKRSVEGCMNAWLFNGVWRMRATSVDPIEDFGTKGLGVKVELRNGTTKTLQPSQSGTGGQGEGIQLVGTDGNALNVDAGAFQTQLGYKDVVQGGTSKAVLRFHFAQPTDADAFKPAKLILQFDQKNVHVAGVKLVKDPSFRIDLSCGGTSPS